MVDEAEGFVPPKSQAADCAGFPALTDCWLCSIRDGNQGLNRPLIL